MRLIPLRDQKSDMKQFLDMFCDYTQEMEIEVGKKRAREEDHRECEQLLHERLCDSNRVIFLFEHMRSIIGFSEVLLEEKCFPDEDLPELCLVVLSFYIVPSHRRKHLGSEFFKLIRTWGRENEASLIEIEVPSYPIQVNQFLEHQGLELVGAGVQNCYRSFI